MKTDQSPTKAKLTVLLKANDTIVAEIENPALWQKVLAMINGIEDTNPSSFDFKSKSSEDGGENDIVSRFAKSLDVSKETLEAALSPSMDSPFLQLNHHYWEAFKKANPVRGTAAVNPIGFAGTVLVLWIKEAKIDVSATQALATAVLDTIGIKDPNSSRGIKNTKWLQPRPGGVILINPAEISYAQKVVRAFCLKKAVGDE